MFCTVFIYTVLHDTQDTLIITANGGGAALVPFLKVGITMPAAILFVVIYSKLSNIISQESLFYWITLSFLALLGVFTFWMYPNQQFLHPDPVWIHSLQQAHPSFQHIYAVMGLWTFALFYLVAELWGAVVVTLLFWQFANEVTRAHEAKRFYSFFGLLANFSLIFAGLTSGWLGDIREFYPAGVDVWGLSLKYITIVLIIVGLFMVGLYRWMHKVVLTDTKYYDRSINVGLHKSQASSPPLWQSTKTIFKSRYLGYIALMVVGYNFSNNLLDIVWKHQLKLQYPNSNDYCVFMGHFTTIMGIATMAMVIFFKSVVQKLGWFWGAIISPVFMLLAAIPFFASVCFPESFAGVNTFIGTTSLFSTLGLGAFQEMARYLSTPLMLAIGLGAFQEIASKGSKYSLFDPTKEMAYMPLSKELRIKGKAFVDVAGSKLGKAISGFMAGSLLIITGASDVSQATEFFAICVFAMIALWIAAVWQLNKLYKTKIALHESQTDVIGIPTKQKVDSKRTTEKAA